MTTPATSESVVTANLSKWIHYLLLMDPPIPWRFFAQALRRMRRRKLMRPRVVWGAKSKVFGCVETLPYKAGARGAFCISIDFELAWGERISNTLLGNLAGLLSRRNMTHVLNAFEKYSIPATWAIVGHLFLNHCNRGTMAGVPHADIPRIGFHKNTNWSFLEGDWFKDDPCSNVEKAPAWYAPDLITQILSSRVNHEIGTHTFSHIDLSNSSFHVADAEIGRSKEVMAQRGLPLHSIVFPGDQEGSYEVLAKHGLIAFRGYREDCVTPPTRSPEGLWDIHRTLELAGIGDERELLVRAKAAVDLAVQTGGVCHLFLHTHETNKRFVEEVLEPVFEYVGRLRSNGALWVATMSDLARYYEAIYHLDIKVTELDKQLIVECRFPSYREDSFGPAAVTLLIRGSHDKIIINAANITPSNVAKNLKRFMINVSMNNSRLMIEPLD